MATVTGWPRRAGGSCPPATRVFFGSMAGKRLASPIIGIASTPNGGGYWLGAADGGIFAFGDARYFGSLVAAHVRQPVVAISATPHGEGYSLVTASGGVYPYGSAHSYGQLSGRRLNSPIVGMASTPDGGGYWLGTADGGVFAFGDAKFYGPDRLPGRGPKFVGITPTSEGRGYWLLRASGSVSRYGDAALLPHHRARCLPGTRCCHQRLNAGEGGAHTRLDNHRLFRPVPASTRAWPCDVSRLSAWTVSLIAMVSWHRLVEFTALAAVIIAVPGPSVLFTVSPRFFTSGRRTALLNVLGNEIGLVVQVVAVAFGVGAIVERSAQVFMAVKLLGAAYLVYLGVQALRHVILSPKPLRSVRGR